VWKAHPELASTMRAETLALSAVALAALQRADEAAAMLTELDTVLAGAAPASQRQQELRAQAADALRALQTRA
jgi:hypothetical protein